MHINNIEYICRSKAESTHMANADEKKMSFIDHLEELRWHIVRSLCAFTIFTILAFINKRFVFDTLILGPQNPDFFINRIIESIGTLLHETLGLNIGSLSMGTSGIELQNIEMAGQFMAHIKVSAAVGLIAASPYLFWEIWSFVKPALYADERKKIRGIVFFMSLLFIIGVLFGYCIIAPLSIHFLATYVVSNDISNVIKLTSYISTVTSSVFSSGVVFELPIMVLFLSKIGLIGPEFMRKYRRHAYILLLLLAAMITPPDVFTQILVCMPLVVLYELSIFIAKRQSKRNANDN